MKIGRELLYLKFPCFLDRCLTYVGYSRGISHYVPFSCLQDHLMTMHNRCPCSVILEFGFVRPPFCDCRLLVSASVISRVCFLYNPNILFQSLSLVGLFARYSLQRLPKLTWLPYCQGLSVPHLHKFVRGDAVSNRVIVWI